MLQQQLKGYARLDAPATRVQPIPFSLLAHSVTYAITPLDRATADMAIIGFFFLLRPGEHTHSSPTADSHPFRLCDITFRIGATTVSAATGNPLLFQRATFVALTFTRQKNGTENEVVGHARSGHSAVCPVLAITRRCLHLRQHHSPPITPLCSVYVNPPTASFITPHLLTLHLRRSATLLFPTLGFDPLHVSARSLRAGGAMALLCAQVDTDVIKLIGRWRSDEMLRYLHLQAYPQMRNMAPLMARGGQFRNHVPPPDPTIL